MSSNNDEFDFSNAERIGDKHYNSDAKNVHITIQLDGGNMAALRDEADRLGIPYQILIGSILHRFATGELIDRKELSIALKNKKE